MNKNIVQKIRNGNDTIIVDNATNIHKGQTILFFDGSNEKVKVIKKYKNKLWVERLFGIEIKELA